MAAFLRECSHCCIHPIFKFFHANYHVVMEKSWSHYERLMHAENQKQIYLTQRKE